MNRILVVLLTFVVTACASPQYNYRPITKDISHPALNSINKAFVGDELVKQGRLAMHDAIYVHSAVRAGILGEYTILPGYYVKEGDAKSGVSAFYSPSRYGEGGSVRVSGLGEPFKVLELFSDQQKICAVSNTNERHCSTKAEVEYTQQPATSVNAFQQTLIYSGLVGDKINIGYREFSSNLARPAFNNDVEYDLSKSNVIGYKGAKLEILEATNEHIEYRLISNFNTAR